MAQVSTACWGTKRNQCMSSSSDPCSSSPWPSRYKDPQPELHFSLLLLPCADFDRTEVIFSVPCIKLLAQHPLANGFAKSLQTCALQLGGRTCNTPVPWSLNTLPPCWQILRCGQVMNPSATMCTSLAFQHFSRCIYRSCSNCPTKDCLKGAGVTNSKAAGRHKSRSHKPVHAHAAPQLYKYRASCPKWRRSLDLRMLRNFPKYLTAISFASATPAKPKKAKLDLFCKGGEKQNSEQSTQSYSTETCRTRGRA